jgi:hypothetical protein
MKEAESASETLLVLLNLKMKENVPHLHQDPLDQFMMCLYMYVSLCVSDVANGSIGTSPNWELLAPRGYRFYMPGSVGPAWHDSYTTAHLEEFQGTASDKNSKKVQG